MSTLTSRKTKTLRIAAMTPGIDVAMGNATAGESDPLAMKKPACAIAHIIPKYRVLVYNTVHV